MRSRAKLIWILAVVLPATAALATITALTRAREAPPIPASCETELRRADRPARAGAAAAGRRRHFFLADCCSHIRGDDGARPIGAIDDDVGGRRRASAASYGVIATDRKICSTDSGPPARVHHFSHPLARARR